MLLGRHRMLKNALDNLSTDENEPITTQDWQKLAQCSSLKKALTGSTEIKDWDTLSEDLSDIFHKAQEGLFTYLAV